MKKTDKQAECSKSTFGNIIINVGNINFNFNFDFDWKSILAATTSITVPMTILLVMLFFSPELRDAFIRLVISIFIG